MRTSIISVAALVVAASPAPAQRRGWSTRWSSTCSTSRASSSSPSTISAT
jgi:hypothetical protein